jgi:hypothetical protein
VRRRELSRVRPGVFVDHTGEPTWLQRAWTAVLQHPGSALGGLSALRAVEGPGSPRPEDPVEIVVARRRNVRPLGGDVVVHRRTGLDQRVLWQVGPPRLRYEEAVLDVAARQPSDFAALGELARAVQSRRTTALRLSATLARRERIPRRRWLTSVLDDVADGTCSVLEHGYLRRVDRPHGLAPARRQVVDRLGSGVVHRDVLYACGLVVELDGRLFHDTARQRDRDFDRDLDAAAAGKDTVRLSWGQVFDRSCWTAGRLALVLADRGWDGHVRACGPTCCLTHLA